MRTISLLELLSKSEKKRLSKYLQYSFFTNKKKYLRLLFGELQSAKQAKADDLFAIIFPGEPFPEHRHKLDKALSDLNKGIEEFLAVSRVREDDGLRHQALVDAYSARLNEPVLRQTVDTVLHKQPGKAGTPDQTDSWHLRFWSRKRKLTHPLADRRKLGEGTLDDMEQDLDTYYLISKTQLMCNLASGHKLYNWQKRRDAPREWLETVRAVASKSPSPLLKVYCELLGLLLDTGLNLPTFFFTLQRHAPYLHTDELRNIVRMAFNECIYRQRTGDKEAYNWHLTIFNWSSKQGLWTAPYAEELFLNIGVLLVKADLRAEFNKHLKSGLEFIPAGRRDQANDLLSACWEYAHGRFSEAQTWLEKVTTRHPRYVLLKHSVAVRNAYMLFLQDDSKDALIENALSRFGVFLQRQTLFSESLSLPYKNLTWFIRQLIQTDPDRKLSKLQLLRELQNRQPTQREWVEQMINRLPT